MSKTEPPVGIGSMEGLGVTAREKEDICETQTTARHAITSASPMVAGATCSKQSRRRPVRSTPGAGCAPTRTAAAHSTPPLTQTGAPEDYLTQHA